jgi:hypothetical protein
LSFPDCGEYLTTAKCELQLRPYNASLMVSQFPPIAIGGGGGSYSGNNISYSARRRLLLSSATRCQKRAISVSPVVVADSPNSWLEDVAPKATGKLCTLSTLCIFSIEYLMSVCN